MRRGENGGYFTIELDLSQEPFPLSYKYAVCDRHDGSFVCYEAGDNRVIRQGAIDAGQVLVNDGFARLPAERWRGAGVAIPVFSLRSEKSFGVGEFSDLPLLADWAQSAGLKLIQILPINDTSATLTKIDSYPYAAISAFALHPIYLNLDRVAQLVGIDLPDELKRQREQLNKLETLDYVSVMDAKLNFARRIFPLARKKLLATDEYRKFLIENKHWLEPYAAFCFFRDKYKTPNFNEWPACRVFNAEEIATLTTRDSDARDEMALHCFIQFHLHTQLHDASAYVHSKGLVLKGDIAIGVHPNAVDVWQQPELFFTNMQAGAPPDAFAAKGQNWSFPTYNWDRMKEDGYDWWKRRLRFMGQYFDAFRIDHILGFFRIWSIPQDAVEGILGYFVPAVPVRSEEFAERGIEFDCERFTTPFINDALLEKLFGSNSVDVKKEFLEARAHGTWSLKQEFSTQRDVENYFARLENQDFKAELKEGLFDLISNVLLIKTPDGNYHFRFGIEQVPSFRELDAATQARKKELYLDYFFKRQEDFWRLQGFQKLPPVKRATNMLICGEDLGMVPECVPEVMEELGLLGLEIQRMPKGSHEYFSRPSRAPYLSVVSPGTHDMSTIRGWWLEDRANTQKFFNDEFSQIGPAPLECDPWISREIIRQHLESPAMWSIFQLQDLLGIDANLRRADIDAERINVPAMSHYYWRYRMHLSLEELMRAQSFNCQVKELVRESGR